MKPLESICSFGLNKSSTIYPSQAITWRTGEVRLFQAWQLKGPQDVSASTQSNEGQEGRVVCKQIPH